MIEILTSNAIGFAAIGAGIAVGLCGLATGMGEAKIGEDVTNKGVVEKDFGKALVMVSIVESPVVYGFTVALIIVGTMVHAGMF